MQTSVQAIYNWYRRVIRDPQYRWWIILGTLIYVLSPLDISPDFLPIVGQIDDIAILTLLISELSQLFIEHIKSRQGKNPISDDTQVNDGTTESKQSVDVKAVSVE